MLTHRSALRSGARTALPLTLLARFSRGLRVAVAPHFVPGAGATGAALHAGRRRFSQAQAEAIETRPPASERRYTANAGQVDMNLNAIRSVGVGAILLVAASCFSGDSKDSSGSGTDLSPTDFYQASEDHKACSENLECENLQLWGNNPCLCTVSICIASEDEIKQLAASVNCLTSDYYEEQDCPYRSDQSWCSADGVCVTRGEPSD